MKKPGQQLRESMQRVADSARRKGVFFTDDQIDEIILKVRRDKAAAKKKLDAGPETAARRR